MPSPRVSSCHSVHRVSKGGRVRLGATYTATRSTASPIPCLYPNSVPSSFPMCSRLAAHRAFFSSRGMPCRPSTVIQPSSSPMMPQPRSSNAGVKRASWGGKASASSRTPSRTSFSDCSRLAMSWTSDLASWTSRTKFSKPRSVREMALLVAKQAVLIALPHDISQVFHVCFSSRLMVHSHPMDVVHCSGARVHYFHHPVEQEGCLGRETGRGGGNAVDAVDVGGGAGSGQICRNTLFPSAKDMRTRKPRRSWFRNGPHWRDAGTWGDGTRGFCANGPVSDAGTGDDDGVWSSVCPSPASRTAKTTPTCWF